VPAFGRLVRRTFAPNGIEDWMVQQALGDGILRVDLEKHSGQTRTRWL
jgi:hypothetical protein